MCQKYAFSQCIQALHPHYKKKKRKIMIIKNSEYTFSIALIPLYYRPLSSFIIAAWIPQNVDYTNAQENVTHQTILQVTYVHLCEVNIDKFQIFSGSMDGHTTPCQFTLQNTPNHIKICGEISPLKQ